MVAHLVLEGKQAVIVLTAKTVNILFWVIDGAGPHKIPKVSLKNAKGPEGRDKHIMINVYDNVNLEGTSSGPSTGS